MVINYALTLNKWDNATYLKVGMSESADVSGASC